MGLGEYWNPPPSGMSPIHPGSGIYTSPQQVDPRDCRWYPDSPWCGGNPFTNPFKEPFASLQAQPYVYECGVGVEFSGTLAWIKTITARIEYRFPGDCRKEPTPPKPDTGTLPQSPGREIKGFDNKDTANRAINDEDWVFAGITYSLGIFGLAASGCYRDPPVLMPTGYKADAASIRCPYRGETHLNANGETTSTEIVFEYQGANIQFDYEEITCEDDLGREYKAQRIIGGHYNYSGKAEKKWSKREVGAEIREFSTVNYKLRRVYFASNSALKYIENNDADAPPPYESLYFSNTTYHADLVYGRYGFIKDYFSNIPLEVDTYLGVTCIGVIKPGFCTGEKPYERNPPPPPPEKKECCMQCCSPSQYLKNDNNQDLSEIIKRLDRIEKSIGGYPAKATIFDENEDAEGAQSKVINWESVAQGQSRIIDRVEKISKIIGIDSLPIKLPKSPVEKVDNNVLGVIFDWFSGTEVKITSVLQLEVYLLKYLNAVFGHWMRKIHIADADAVKEGEQPLDIVMPDIATTLETLLTTCTGNHKALGLITDIVSKCMIEICNCKLDAAEAKLIVRDIQQWLDYPTRELAVSVPIGINVPGLEINSTGNESEEEKATLEAQRKELEALKKDISKFMQPSQVKVIYEDWDGTGSLTDRLLHLATIAGTNRGQGV